MGLIGMVDGGVAADSKLKVFISYSRKDDARTTRTATRP